MNFTFGIITAGFNDNLLIKTVESIKKLGIPKYEIIIVGNTTVCADININFDESHKHMWITKKKNIITKTAKYENIVYLHDYIEFDINWYYGFVKFGNSFDVCMNKIHNIDGTRFRDWCMIETSEKINNPGHCLLPYNILDQSKHMYFSGSYWVAKKTVMVEYPLDETLSWGESEDVVWSKQVTEKYDFSMNTYSLVRLLKYKELYIDKWREI